MADGNGKRRSTSETVVYNQEIPKDRLDLVRQEYKRYKRKKPPPDLSEVIDFEDPSTFNGRVAKYKLDLEATHHSKFGLRCVTKWRAYELNCCPGFIFIVNPFLTGAQHFWTRRCIADFPRKPNVCNLDAHMTLDSTKSVWELSQRGGECVDLMDKLRWVHLGYQFDYNVVDYKPDKYYDFPSDLAHMMKYIAKAIGYPDYSPETGIVNYYPLGSSMGGHTDHYESDLSWPLISLSFGQSAIFLIGGPTRAIKPTALYIRSGDIVVMSGEARTAFHAVPRIIKEGKENEPPVCLEWKKEIFTTAGENTEFHSKGELQCDLTPLKVELQAAQDTTNIPDISNIPDVMAAVPDVRVESNFQEKGCQSDPRTSKNTSYSTHAIRENAKIQQDEERQKPTEFFSDRVQKNSCFNENCNNVTSKLSEAEDCECNQQNFLPKSMEYLSMEEWRRFELYLSKTRINVNVRQVHEKGKTINSLGNDWKF